MLLKELNREIFFKARPGSLWPLEPRRVPPPAVLMPPIAPADRQVLRNLERAPARSNSCIEISEVLVTDVLDERVPKGVVDAASNADYEFGFWARTPGRALDHL